MPFQMISFYYDVLKVIFIFSISQTTKCASYQQLPENFTFTSDRGKLAFKESFTLSSRGTCHGIRLELNVDFDLL